MPRGKRSENYNLLQRQIKKIQSGKNDIGRQRLIESFIRDAKKLPEEERQKMLAKIKKL